MLAQMYATLVVTVNDGGASIVVPKPTRWCARVRRRMSLSLSTRTRKVQRRATSLGTSHAGESGADQPHGPGLESLPVVSRNSLTRTPGAAEKPQIRVIEGLQSGDKIVQSGALALFNEMEQQQSQLSGK